VIGVYRNIASGHSLSSHSGNARLSTNQERGIGRDSSIPRGAPAFRELVPDAVGNIAEAVPLRLHSRGAELHQTEPGAGAAQRHTHSPRHDLGQRPIRAARKPVIMSRKDQMGVVRAEKAKVLCPDGKRNIKVVILLIRILEKVGYVLKDKNLLV